MIDNKDYQDVVNRAIFRFLKSMNLDFKVESNVYETCDKPGHFINLGFLIHYRDFMRNQNLIFDYFRDFVQALKNSDLTLEFRQEIEALKKENTELREKLDRKDSIILDLVEDSEETDVFV